MIREECGNQTYDTPDQQQPAPDAAVAKTALSSGLAKDTGLAVT